MRKSASVEIPNRLNSFWPEDERVGLDELFGTIEQEKNVNRSSACINSKTG